MKVLSYIAIFLSFNAIAVESLKMADTIKQGYGYIDLFKAQQSANNLTAIDLESLRIEHGNKLVFAVDINKAANGTEKASTQGGRK